VATVSGDQVGALAFDEVVRAYVPAQRGRVHIRTVPSDARIFLDD